MVKSTKRFKPIPLATGSVNATNAPFLVIGRNDFVSRFWKKTKAGSNLHILSERRMGKTWAIWLAIAKKPTWANPFFFDAEQVNTVEEFVWKLNQEMHRQGFMSDNAMDKATDWFRRIKQRMRGQSIGEYEVPSGLDPWSTFLEDTCRNFVEESGDRMAVLIIDELPFLIDKIYKNQGHRNAAELLDKLRAMRQTITSFRMSFCGSLGMHIVLQKLKDSGYTGQPINDMEPLELTPLITEDATYLAAGLLLSEKIKCSNLEDVATVIAKVSSGIPYYIKHIIIWLSDHPVDLVDPEMIDGTLQKLFDTSGDPAGFLYYDTRLDQYYPEDIVKKARAALDILSRNNNGLHFNELLNLVRYRPSTLTIDPESLLEILRTLRDDHYLVGQSSHWRFKLEIVRRWWYEHRGGLEL
ncbi:MAG: hypothetical protein IID16_10290 [Candidatus Marinimicrobia bacterium]|nr:hypothetical protein [Candidatus Neomarinimicrobiota bacterium]